MFVLSRDQKMTLSKFHSLLEGEEQLGIGDQCSDILEETREFIDHLLQNRVKVYGLTTGFADLRDRVVLPEHAADLSNNILESHDAGIGPPLSQEIVLGAMILRANALAKGYSGFRVESLRTLVVMINERIIPDIPCHGSLGASGDLALLARLGRAMQGKPVLVSWRGERMSAGDALKQAGIRPFEPQAKEGLALTNGTPFMASMAAIAWTREARLVDNVLALQPLFLEAVGAIEAAFSPPIHAVRGQAGQKLVASLLYERIKDSPWIDREGVQDDYCIRCIPQILGPKIDLLAKLSESIEQELDAVTDNPLLFKGEWLNSQVSPSRILFFKEEKWSVLSGGNFHGEVLTTAADAMVLANAKIALTLERHMTYLLNPLRNKRKLPAYLIGNPEEVGLSSGYMVTQYTGNDLAQKISALAVPTGMYNITSANESEDVVSYGSTACQRVLSQIDFFEDFMAIYLAILLQAYAIRLATVPAEGRSSYGHSLFLRLNERFAEPHPVKADASFSERYATAKVILATPLLGKSQIHNFAQREYSYA